MWLLLSDDTEVWAYCASNTFPQLRADQLCEINLIVIGVSRCYPQPSLTLRDHEKSVVDRRVSAIANRNLGSGLMTGDFVL